MILAGGYGTRLSEETHSKPKPMVEIGGRPILWHIMKMYSAHGINDFIVCSGYRGYVIKEYFANYSLHMADVTFDLGKGTVEISNKPAEPWRVTIIDTGEGWDLTAVRQDIDGIFSRRNELCVDCSLTKARKSLSGILVALRPGGEIQRGKARLLLESTPRSQVFLNGRDQGKTPLDLSVDARVPLEVLMIAEGYNDFAEEFVLNPGENRKKHVRLTRKRGIIRITSNPSGATIYINGKPEIDSDNKPLLTPADLRLVFGQHNLKLELEKYEVTTETLRINKRNAGTKNITLKPKPGRLIAVSYTHLTLPTILLV